MKLQSMELFPFIKILKIGPFMINKSRPRFLSFRASAITLLQIIMLHILKLVFLMLIVRRIRQSHQASFIFILFFFSVRVLFFAQKGVFNFRNSKKKTDHALAFVLRIPKRQIYLKSVRQKYTIWGCPGSTLYCVLTCSIQLLRYHVHSTISTIRSRGALILVSGGQSARGL